MVIVGGGLTGCAAAQAMSAAGLSTVLVEAGTVASGVTAFTSGLLLPEPGPAFRTVVDEYGLRAGRSAFVAWRKAAVDASVLLRRLGIRCGLTPLDSVRAGGSVDERVLRREFEARHDAGLDATWLTPKQVQTATRAAYTCGFRVSGAQALDPGRAALGLASAARARKARVFEQSPVRRIVVGRRQVDVTTDAGIVSADTVVIATGMPTPLFAPLARHVTRRDRFFVMTDVMPASMRRHLWHGELAVGEAHDSSHRVFRTPTHHAIVSGAEGPLVPARRSEAAVREWTFELMYELLRRYPVISGLAPATGWRLTSSVTRDGLPFIGPHRNYPRHLFALGCAGDGSVTAAFLAARVLTRALTGASDKTDAVFGFTR